MYLNKHVRWKVLYLQIRRIQTCILTLGQAPFNFSLFRSAEKERSGWAPSRLHPNQNHATFTCVVISEVFTISTVNFLGLTALIVYILRERDNGRRSTKDSIAGPGEFSNASTRRYPASHSLCWLGALAWPGPAAQSYCHAHACHASTVVASL